MATELTITKFLDAGVDTEMTEPRPDGVTVRIRGDVHLIRGDLDLRRGNLKANNILLRGGITATGFQSNFGTLTCESLDIKGRGNLPPPDFGEFPGSVRIGADTLLNGSLTVTGDIQLANADCAEEFDVKEASAGDVSPGTVVVISDDGFLRCSSSAYDKRVAGVVSGGGDYKPALVLNKRSSDPGRIAVALLGKVACKVDATYGAIAVGDLLTTSSTPGYAMKANDPSRAFGAVIGKALRPFGGGKGLVPILIALQ